MRCFQLLLSGGLNELCQPRLETWVYHPLQHIQEGVSAHSTKFTASFASEMKRGVVHQPMEVLYRISLKYVQYLRFKKSTPQKALDRLYVTINILLQIQQNSTMASLWASSSTFRSQFSYLWSGDNPLWPPGRALQFVSCMKCQSSTWNPPSHQ